MRSILKLFNRIRRNTFQILDNNYIDKKLAKRKGKCKKCGFCCRGCNFLDRKTNLCKTYNKRPIFCHKQFPLDKIDQKIWGVTKCGYFFNK